MNGLVIIAGSAEARAAARCVPGAQVLAPQPDRVAYDWPGAVRFGPVTANALAGMGARCVIEAAHPCDAETAFATAHACRILGLPRLQLVRPAWRAGVRDTWHSVARTADIACHIPRGARVLVTAGRRVLPALRKSHAFFVVRRMGRGGGLGLRHGRFQCVSGPFDLGQELALLRKDRIDRLLVHNAGGAGGWPKLAAARQLHLPVVMLDRPARPGGPSVATVNEALAWAAQYD